MSFLQGPGDINTKIQEIKERAKNKKIIKEVQPYIIVVGPSLTEIESSYIIIDKIHFKCTSTLKAVDLLFKLFFALRIKYPPQAAHIWLLIQKGIFKINEFGGTKDIAYIADILNALK